MMKKKSETKIEVDQIYVTNNADLYLITSPTTNGCKLSAINTSNTYNLLLHYIPATAQNGVVNHFTDKFEVPYRKLFFFELGNPKVTVHKAKGHST